MPATITLLKSHSTLFVPCPVTSVNSPYSEDDSLTPDNPLQMVDGACEALDSIGRTGNPALSFKRWALDAGFTRIEEHHFRMPVGSWPKDPRPKEIGAFLSANIAEGVEGFTAVLNGDVLGWSRQEMEVLNARVRSALSARGVHAIFDFLVVTRMKPRE
ncbi:putative AC transposase [Purpureocillium lavendulum]|uniref:AC transposase n=1 Tax=Purpureocillium lavendulum TaxID=1247861 RepID=A0AB34FDR2_9HYPO|nr:putative AC transposase [Purpureocillium lavendulum]